MNTVFLVVSLLSVCIAFSEAFFLIKAKTEPILFCIKICPLYCHPRSKRDVEMPPGIPDYIDDDTVPYIWRDWPEEEVHSPYHYLDHVYYCKRQRSTTTKKPKTTTTTKKPMPDPSYICVLCKEKCHYPPKPQDEDK